MMTPDLADAKSKAAAALAAAERSMLELSHDPNGFRKAEKELEAAKAEVRRLEFVEKHEAELAQRAALENDKRALADAQERAVRAKERAAELSKDVVPIADRLTEIVRELRRLNSDVERGLNHEMYALRSRLIPRPALSVGLGLDGEPALQLLTAVRELLKLCSISPEAAEIKARQRNL